MRVPFAQELGDGILVEGSQTLHHGDDSPQLGMRVEDLASQVIRTDEDPMPPADHEEVPEAKEQCSSLRLICRCHILDIVDMQQELSCTAFAQAFNCGCNLLVQ